MACRTCVPRLSPMLYSPRTRSPPISITATCPSDTTGRLTTSCVTWRSITAGAADLESATRARAELRRERRRRRVSDRALQVRMWAGTFPCAGRAFAPAYHRFGISGTPEWESVRGASTATIGRQAVATLTATFWRRSLEYLRAARSRIRARGGPSRSCPRPDRRVGPEVFRQLRIKRAPGNVRSAAAKNSVYHGAAVLAIIPQWQEDMAEVQLGHVPCLSRQEDSRACQGGPIVCRFEELEVQVARLGHSIVQADELVDGTLT